MNGEELAAVAAALLLLQPAAEPKQRQESKWKQTARLEAVLGVAQDDT